MLAALQIRDIVLIDQLDLDFGSGLSVLTGETGAGKSIILDALGLALGARADRGLVRIGAKSGSVSALFELPPCHPALLQVQVSGISVEGTELLLRRVITEDGRARAFVNDEPVSQGLLRTLGESLVEIHGQHDGEQLLDPAAHRALVDAYGGHAPLLTAVAEAHTQWQQAEALLRAHEAELERASRDADYIAHAADELGALDPKPGEEGQLAAERAGFSQGAKIAEACAEADALLTRDGGAAGRLAQALRRIERVAAQAGERLVPALEALERATSEAIEAEALVAAAARDLGFDPGRMERIEERLFALRAAARKFNVHPDALAGIKAEFSERRMQLSEGGHRTAALRKEAATARALYVDAAAGLREKRLAAAKSLGSAIAKELKPLKLEKAQFEAEVTPLEEGQWGAGGTERIRFLVATNPGTPPGPLTKIASGGERARFFLALKVVLARGTEAATLIFDEVDQGVGGAVAAAVGERLARLASGAQVLVVTHSPQVAARAQHHLRISKRALKRGDPMLVTRIEALTPEARREEIARMLSGAEITNEARAAAERLIAVGAAR